MQGRRQLIGDGIVAMPRRHRYVVGEEEWVLDRVWLPFSNTNVDDGMHSWLIVTIGLNVDFTFRIGLNKPESKMHSLLFVLNFFFFF